jgi:hypothetical protein
MNDTDYKKQESVNKSPQSFKGRGSVGKKLQGFFFWQRMVLMTVAVFSSIKFLDRK